MHKQIQYNKGLHVKKAARRPVRSEANLLFIHFIKTTFSVVQVQTCLKFIS